MGSAIISDTDYALWQEKRTAHKSRVEQRVRQLTTAMQIEKDFPWWVRKIDFANSSGKLSTDDRWWLQHRHTIPGYIEMLQERLGPLFKVSLYEGNPNGFGSTPRYVLVAW